MKAIIFDFDGTIGNSFTVALEIAHSITKRHQLVSPEEVLRFRQLKMLDVAIELEIPKWQWPFLLMRGRRQMDKRLKEILPFEGIDQILETLYTDNFQLFIVSSNSNRNINQFLMNNKLDNYFTKVYGGIGLLGKARALKHIMKINNLAKSEAVYVGDEPRDIEASKEVGIPCISVSWGYNSPSLLNKYRPLKVVDTPEQLIVVLKTLDSLDNR